MLKATLDMPSTPLLMLLLNKLCNTSIPNSFTEPLILTVPFSLDPLTPSPELMPGLNKLFSPTLHPTKGKVGGGGGAGRACFSLWHLHCQEPDVVISLSPDVQHTLGLTAGLLDFCLQATHDLHSTTLPPWTQPRLSP